MGRIKKKKRAFVRFASLLILSMCTLSAYGKNHEIPDSLQYLFHNNFYLRYSQGINLYLTDARSGYAGFPRKKIWAGMTLEPEIGTFVKNYFQIGVSYLYMNGSAEETYEDVFSEKTYGYVDVFFSGGTLKARYFIVNKKKVKIPLGIEGIYGKCYLKTGTTSDLNKGRGLFSDSAPWGYKGKAFGGGILSSFSYYPAWYFSIGIDVGLRILLSQRLKDRLWENTEEIQPLNLSSLNIRAYLSLQF